MVAYSISFAARYSDSRTLEIGDRSSSGHDCCFVIGRHISIGKECMIANDRPRGAARKDVVPGLGLQTARPPSPRYSLLVFAANLGHTARVSIVVSVWLNSNSHRGTTYKMVDRIPIENKTL